MNVSAIIRLDKRRPYKSGRYPLKLFVTVKRQRKDYTLKFGFTEGEWEKIQSPNLKERILVEKKKEVDKIRGEALKCIKQLGDNFTFDLFEALMFGTPTKVGRDKRDVFAEFELKEKELREDMQFGSADIYNVVAVALKKYRNKLEFSQITVPFLKGWEKHLVDAGNTKSSVGIRMRHLRHIVKRGVKNGALAESSYPFGREEDEKYQIPTSQNVKKAVDGDVMAKIIAYRPDQPLVAQARAVWLFIFYCNGMNLADVVNLRYADIEDNFLTFYRQKTIRTRKEQVPVRLHIPEPARQIIEDWGVKPVSPKAYIFGFLDDSMSPEEKHNRRKYVLNQINKRLKRMMKQIGVSTDITTYVARHTWATTLLRNDVSVGYISKGMGHASMLTTEKYLADFTDDQKKDVSDILAGIGRSSAAD